MATVDWDWFFSSVAQSAAAIVGIFGAFIVTKILANQATFSERMRRIDELIRQGEKLSDSADRLDFSWYHQHKNESAMNDVQKLLKEDDSLEPDSIYDKVNFSPYFSRTEAIDQIRAAKVAREARLAREKAARIEQLKTLKALGRTDLYRPEESFSSVLDPNFHIAPLLSKEREEIDSLYDEVRHHKRLALDLYQAASTNPESSRVITWALLLTVALFFSGVIYPLSFLPTPSDWKPDLSFWAFFDELQSLRGVLLLLISIFFSAMVGIFLVMNLRLRIDRVMLEELASYMRSATYSEFFANKDDYVDYRRMRRSRGDAGESVAVEPAN